MRRTIRAGALLAVLMAVLACGSVAARAQQAEWAELLPDEKLSGWTRIPIPSISGVDPKMQWKVNAAEKTIICTGEGGHEWLRYNQELGDFILEVEWRFTPRGADEKRYNSGIGVRMTKTGDIWHQAQTGLTGGYLFGETITDGSIRRFNLREAMKENRIKPAGEWNHYQIRAQGDRITMAVNGEVVNELTGVGLRRGYIGLEAEGFEIRFRNLRVRKLD